MPEVDGKQFAYTDAGKAAAKKAAKAVKKPAVGANRKMLKKASNRDAVTKSKMGYGG